MKKIVALCFVILLLVGCTPKKPVEVIQDVTQFSRISIEELQDKLGEAEEIDNWTYETGKNSFAVTTYSYTIDNNYYEFLVADDAIVRLTIYSNQYWTNEGERFTYTSSNKKDILEMFGLETSKTTKKSVDNNVTLKHSPFNDKIAVVDIQDINKEDKTFGFIKITYDLRYFD